MIAVAREQERRHSLDKIRRCARHNVGPWPLRSRLCRNGDLDETFERGIDGGQIAADDLGTSLAIGLFGGVTNFGERDLFGQHSRQRKKACLHHRADHSPESRRLGNALTVNHEQAHPTSDKERLHLSWQHVERTLRRPRRIEQQRRTILGEFREALSRADARLFEEVRRRPELQGMGTTLTMAYSLAGRLFIAHVGDSRCYLLRGGALHQLTRDHTVVGELVRRGLIPPENAAQHQLRHVITNVVGGDVPGLKVEVHKVALAPGDVLLLCSDGLTEMVADPEIAAILGQNADPRAACAQLIARANELGGSDNVTVVVARHDLAG